MVFESFGSRKVSNKGKISSLKWMKYSVNVQKHEKIRLWNFHQNLSRNKIVSNFFFVRELSPPYTPVFVRSLASHPIDGFALKLGCFLIETQADWFSGITTVNVSASGPIFQIYIYIYISIYPIFSVYIIDIFHKMQHLCWMMNQNASIIASDEWKNQLLIKSHI